MACTQLPDLRKGRYLKYTSAIKAINEFLDQNQDVIAIYHASKLTLTLKKFPRAKILSVISSTLSYDQAKAILNEQNSKIEILRESKKDFRKMQILQGLYRDFKRECHHENDYRTWFVVSDFQLSKLEKHRDLILEYPLIVERLGKLRELDVYFSLDENRADIKTLIKYVA